VSVVVDGEEGGGCEAAAAQRNERITETRRLTFGLCPGSTRYDYQPRVCNRNPQRVLAGKLSRANYYQFRYYRRHTGPNK
jgi:hypothetical protein